MWLPPFSLLEMDDYSSKFSHNIFVKNIFRYAPLFWRTSLFLNILCIMKYWCFISYYVWLIWNNLKTMPNILCHVCWMTWNGISHGILAWLRLCFGKIWKLLICWKFSLKISKSFISSSSSSVFFLNVSNYVTMMAS